MRLRWLGIIGVVAWLTVVVVVTASSAMSVAIAVLFAGLGVLLIAALVVLLAILGTLQRQTARTGRKAKRQKPAPRRGKPASAGQLTKKQVEQLGAVVDKEQQRTFRQVEALHNLYAMIDIRHALPASRGWPASPDLLLFLVDLIDRRRPTVVVECGSGLSTLCMALAFRRFGIAGKVVALEHLAGYAEQTQELLRRHGVDDIAEVRVAPLTPVEIGDISVDWYDPSAWQDLIDVGLLFVDGPPSNLSPHSRYPSLPFFADRLVPGAHIVLDDYRRAKERAVIERWQQEYADRITLESIPLEKGAALLTFE